MIYNIKGQKKTRTEFTSKNKFSSSEQVGVCLARASCTKASVVPKHHHVTLLLVEVCPPDLEQVTAPGRSDGRDDAACQREPLEEVSACV